LLDIEVEPKNFLDFCAEPLGIKRKHEEHWEIKLDKPKMNDLGHTDSRNDLSCTNNDASLVTCVSEPKISVPKQLFNAASFGMIGTE